MRPSVLSVELQRVSALHLRSGLRPQSVPANRRMQRLDWPLSWSWINDAFRDWRGCVPTNGSR